MNPRCTACTLPDWECYVLGRCTRKPAPVVPTVTHGDIKIDLMHDEGFSTGDPRTSLTSSDMIRVETPQGFVEITVSNGATHVMISESQMGETKAEFMIASNGTFQKIG